MSLPSAANSRFTIISWINDTLLLPLTKIEELGSGNVYCQLLDAAYPERVPLHKVKWDAKLEVEFLHNFKILLTSFEYLGIGKKIDIQKLAKAKYQDNLQFVQWLKSSIEQKIDYKKYEPLKRRNFAKIYLGFADKKKFNMGVSINKENADVSLSFIKSNSKTNLTINSSVMFASKISNQNYLGESKTKNIMKTLPDQSVEEVSSKSYSNRFSNPYKKIPDKRGNIGPTNFLNLSLNKNPKKLQMKTQRKQKMQVKNVQVIESQGQGSLDEFF